MEFCYQITSATLSLSPERGFVIRCGCEIEELRDLPLKSGKKWGDSIHSLSIFPASTGPYQEPFDDARVGEFDAPIKGGDGNGLYESWLQVPDDHFNVLYAQMAQGNLKIHVQLCFNEDQQPCTSSGVFDDTAWSALIPIMTYRANVTLIPYVAPEVASDKP